MTSTIERPIEAPKDDAPNKKKPRYTRKQRAIAGGAALLALVGLGAGAKFGIDALSAAPAPVAGAPADPGTTEVPVTPEVPAPSVEDLTIPAGLDVEQLGPLLVEERLQTWGSAGANTAEERDKLVEDWMDYGRENGVDSVQAFADALAAKNAQDRAVGLFGSDWVSNENVATYVQRITTVNAGFIVQYLATFADGAPYSSTETTSDSRELADTDNDPNTRTFEVDVTFSETNDPTGNDTRMGTYTFNTLINGSNEIITSIDLDLR